MVGQKDGQGTVWGPWLWNIFYEDARRPLQLQQYNEIVYADDLNAYKEFALSVPNTDLVHAAKDCQKELHAWGRANRVAFDPKKESMHVLSHWCPEGDAFKILGVLAWCNFTRRKCFPISSTARQPFITHVTPISRRWMPFKRAS